MTKDDKAKVKPADTVSTSHGIQAKIYRNAVKGSDVPLYKAQFLNWYRPKNSEQPELAKSYGETEVLVLMGTCLEAWLRMVQLRKADQQSARNEEKSTEVADDAATDVEDTED